MKDSFDIRKRLVYVLPMNKTNCNTDENVKIVNNTHFDIHSLAGAHSALLAVIENGTCLPEEFDGVFTLEVFTRPSGSKYGVLNFA